MEEIKASDLMINNWVEYDGKYYKIDALSEEYPFLNTDSFGVGVVTYRNIRGIPLAEEILLKCEFKLDDNKNYWLSLDLDKHLGLIPAEGYYYPQLVQEPELSCDNLSVFSLNRISALHELQNILRCLTKTELIVEL